MPKIKINNYNEDSFQSSKQKMNNKKIKKMK